MSWEKVKLNEVTVLLTSGGRPKGGAISNGIPSLGAEHLDGNGGFIFKNVKYIPEVYYEKLKNGKIYTNDILIVKDGATTGKISYVDESFPFKQAAINEHVFQLKINSKICFPKFVFHYLKSDVGQGQLMSDFRGATVGGISRSILECVSIPIPPLSIQKQIAETLDKADALYRKDQELLQKYDDLAPSIFYEMFGDLMQSSNNAVNLSEVVIINPARPRLQLSHEKEVSFIPMEAVGEDGFLKRKYIRKLGDVVKGYTYFEEGDVLFAKITPCMENGKGAIVNNLVNGIGFGSTEFYVIRPSERLTSRFIHTLLRLPAIRAEAEKQMTGSAGQKRVSKSFFENLSIVPPKFEKQIEFERRLNVIERGRENVINSIDKSQSLFATLLQSYFS